MKKFKMPVMNLCVRSRVIAAAGSIYLHSSNTDTAAVRTRSVGELKNVIK